MRILGIDPGSSVTGWGVVEKKGSQLVLVGAGAIVAKGDALAERLACIAAGLREVIAAHAPEAAAVESLFFAKNVRSAIALGHARGVALLAIAEAKLPVAEYAPAEVKRAIVGNGRAEKEQVAHMVRVLLNHRGPQARLDVTDALAVAICHAHTAASRLRIAAR